MLSFEDYLLEDVAVNGSLKTGRTYKVHVLDTGNEHSYLHGYHQAAEGDTADTVKSKISKLTGHKTNMLHIYEQNVFRAPVKINAPGHPNHGKSGVVLNITSADQVKVKLADGSHSFHRASELEKG